MGHLNIKSQFQLFDIPLIRHPSYPKIVGEVRYMVQTNCGHMKAFWRKFVEQVILHNHQYVPKSYHECVCSKGRVHKSVDTHPSLFAFSTEQVDKIMNILMFL